MRFTDLMREIFDVGRRDADGNIVLNVSAQAANSVGKVQIEELALFSVIDLLSSAAACCEWRTYRENKRVQGLEWYAWNVQPNPAQDGVEFRRDLFARLFLGNEVLVFERGGHRYIAESWHREAEGFAEPYYDGVTYRGATLPFKVLERDALHYRLSLSPQAAALRNNLCRLYSDLLDEGKAKYMASGGKSGILEIDNVAKGSKTFETDFEKIMNERFKTYFNSKNAVLPLFQGYHYIPQNGEASKKTTSEVSDMKAILEQAQTAACNAYHIPPSILRGEVTNLTDAVDSLLTFGLKPALKTVQAENNRKLYGTEVIKGNMMRISTVGLLSVSPFTQADKVDKLVADRIYNPEGIREHLDDEPIGEEWAKEYTMTKNLENVGGGQ